MYMLCLCLKRWQHYTATANQLQPGQLASQIRSLTLSLSKALTEHTFYVSIFRIKKNLGYNTIADQPVKFCVVLEIHLHSCIVVTNKPVSR